MKLPNFSKFNKPNVRLSLSCVTAKAVALAVAMVSVPEAFAGNPHLSSSSSSSSAAPATSSSSSKSSSSIASSAASSSAVSSSSSSKSSTSSISSSSSVSSASSSAGSSYAPAQTPLFLTASAKPHIAIVMSVDQELSKKAYSDYANLDGNVFTMADTTYRDDFDYYGYFDSNYCYTFSDKGSPGVSSGSSYFTPYAKATVGANTTLAHQCAGTGANNLTEAGAWSGNFLNWATMTRMDILRRVLFGGKRSVDTTSQTILERAYLPKDIHAFSKTYNKSDINKYTPFASTAIPKSFCNVSSGGGSSDYPVMRMATGSFPQWASSEGAQCQTGNTTSPAAYPATLEVVVKVDACVTGKDGDSSSRCRVYGSATLKKPAGLLQKYGEDGNIKFSLTTGSYLGHLTGGVLRVPASLFASNSTASNDEVDLTTGIFNSSVSGIIKNISSFKVANYDWGTLKYSDCTTPGIEVSSIGSSAYKACTDWGNPIGETFLEMLRYISGKTSPTSGFAFDDATANGAFKGVPGVTYKTSWTDPWVDWCATCSAIVISTGSNSFDGDNLSSASDVQGLSASNVATMTDKVGDLEAQAVYGTTFKGTYYAGSNGVCAPLQIAGLSKVLGICPELPALKGTYSIAGMAYHAHITDLRPDLTGTGAGKKPGKRNLTTYTIDLAESVPTIKMKVNGKEVSLIPTCQSNNGSSWNGCSLIDVIVENLQTDANNNPVSGSYLITWEDSSWGNDYDLDAAQRLEFCVGSACGSGVGTDEVQIKNSVVSAQAGFGLQFSYSIYGVNSERGTFYNNPAQTVSSTSISGGIVTPWVQRPGGVNFNASSTNNPWLSSGSTYPSNVGYSKLIFYADSSAGTVRPLKKPLWYAAKYGSFIDSNGNDIPDVDSEWGTKSANSTEVTPNNFFSVSNPSVLEDKMETVLLTILRRNGSASAVATSSTRLTGDDFVYQAVFESKVWSGELRAYQPDSQGRLSSIATYKTTDAGRMPTSSAGRNVIFYKPSDGSTQSLSWNNLDVTQQSLLTLSGDPSGRPQERVNWLLGDATYEDNNTKLRERILFDANNQPVRNILGDIVNSTPTYAGSYDFKYDNLTTGGSSYKSYVSQKSALDPLVIVGANDGMVHAFVANSKNTSDILTEKFAYIPNLVFGKLVNLTKPDYGSTYNPHQYYIDGSITVGDVYMTSDTSWHTVAVGALGAGGKGIYALDITNPSSPKVLFEFTHPSMGYVLGKIYVVPAQDGNWYAVFANGPGSGTSSKLFMVDINNPVGSGSQTKLLETGEGTGLSSPTILIDAHGVLTNVYAGDLSGNMWRFDVSNPVATNWDKAHNAVYKVFVTNTGQPITATPTIGYNYHLSSPMVYFGTGKYFDVNDNLFSSIRQSFYAVPDLGAGNAITRSSMEARTLTTTYTTPASRTINVVVPDWVNKKGWYMDLDLDVGAQIGERITNKVLLVQDTLIMTTLIPSQKTCEAGGQAWLMGTCAICDSTMNTGPKIDSTLFSELFPGNPVIAIGGAGPTTNAGSSSSSSSSASPCRSSVNVSIVNSGTLGQGLTDVGSSACADNFGRQSWRQLR